MINMTNKIISFNKFLSSDFVNHITTTNNLCIYKLGNHYIPQTIFFPKVHSLTLINCNTTSIDKILHPRFFPNLNTINYLSLNPGHNNIHKRFNTNIKWVFPDKNYEYYNLMVKSGYGIKDRNIIKKYITNKKMINGVHDYDISYDFDIIIPNYGTINGVWWSSQFYEYLVRLQNNELKQETEEELLERERIRTEIKNSSFEDIV
jgi:hypothetical protein